MLRSLSLKELILCCTNPSDKNWEKAWYEFFRRYKDRLYFYSKGCCTRWQIPRLNIQIDDVIEDIVCEATVQIYKNLRQFKNTEQEQKFFAWLQIICERSTSRVIQKMFNKSLLNLDISDIQEFKSSFDQESLWEIFEKTVEYLRDLLKQHINTERDIHIFLLHTWCGFRPKQITVHPCFNTFSTNSIEVIISRIRKKIN